MALLRMSRRKIVSVPTSLYILVMRGTPLMLQIFAIYFAIPTLTGVNLDRMNATILAFSINYAAYFAEIFRGGIQSIPVGRARGRSGAGHDAGTDVFSRHPAADGKRVLLPVSNEVITLVKDTSLANVIAVAELFRAAKNEASRTASVEPLFVAGLFYLLMNGVVSLVFSYLNRRMAYYKD
ncbi:MAG: amino acid ABC transporter permease [Christensenellales bacterium]